MRAMAAGVFCLMVATIIAVTGVATGRVGPDVALPDAIGKSPRLSVAGGPWAGKEAQFLRR